MTTVHKWNLNQFIIEKNLSKLWQTSSRHSLFFLQFRGNWGKWELTPVWGCSFTTTLRHKSTNAASDDSSAERSTQEGLSDHKANRFVRHFIFTFPWIWSLKDSSAIQEAKFSIKDLYLCPLWRENCHVNSNDLISASVSWCHGGKVGANVFIQEGFIQVSVILYKSRSIRRKMCSWGILITVHRL